MRKTERGCTDGEKQKNKKKIIIVTIVSILLSIPVIILPVTTIAVYESFFGTRCETAPWIAFSVEDYEGLQVERSDFQFEDVTLAGYKYSKSRPKDKRCCGHRTRSWRRLLLPALMNRKI